MLHEMVIIARSREVAEAIALLLDGRMRPRPIEFWDMFEVVQHPRDFGGQVLYPFNEGGELIMVTGPNIIMQRFGESGLHFLSRLMTEIRAELEMVNLLDEGYA